VTAFIEILVEWAAKTGLVVTLDEGLWFPQFFPEVSPP